MSNLTNSWLAAVRLGVAVGVAYFLAAQLGLALRSQVGMAVFWPAAGIATGALIALGPAARLPVAVAVAAASFASSLLIGRNTWLAVTFVVLNAGEVLLTAWLVVRRFGGAFELADVPHVLGFLVASAIAAAIGATGAAIAVSFAEPMVFPLRVWRIWFSAGLLGTVTVAPLLIGLREAVRDVPRGRELVEGAIALVTLAALSAILISLPQGPWATALPVAFVFPLLLWIAVRCQPVFGAAALFVVTLVIIWSTSFNMGHFGDASIPLADRILAAQTLVLAGALLVLVLTALFSERRRREAALKHSKERLQLALEGAELGAFSADLPTGRLEWDARAAQIHGQNASTMTIKESRRFVHPDDRPRIDAALAEAKGSGGRWNAEYRVLPPTGDPHAGETRWVAVDTSIVRDRQGAPVGLLGVTRDITERKRAEQALVERNILLALTGRAARVGSFVYDVDTEIMQISEDYAAIHGLPEGTAEIARSECLTRVHPDDLEQVGFARSEAFLERQSEYSVEYRIHRPSGELRWIEIRCFITYEGDGRPKRVVGVSIDVTERKRAELRLAERNTQLELASKVARVGSFVIDLPKGLVHFSPGSAAICGLPDGTVEISRDDARKLAHPEDLSQLDATRNLAFLKKDREFVVQFRIIRADDGEVRWIEARSIIFYDQGGQPLRLIAVIIDITERRLAEQALAERNAQLALAGRAALVGCYVYDVNKGTTQISQGYAAIHGLPEATTDTTIGEWRTRVHPDDLARAEGLREQAFADRRKEDNAEYRIILPTSEIRWIERRGIVSYDQDGRPERVVGVNIDITERKRAEEQQRVLVAELDHRVKNALATVSSVVSQTAVGRRSVADFEAALSGRIRSMATTHELLSSGRWQGISLTELIRHELAPYATRHNTNIRGPELVLRPEAGQALAIVLHELATNAAKYGALSTKEGSVSIRWKRSLNRHPTGLILEWQEDGGPPVITPEKSGFGMSTIRDLIPYEFGGKVDLTLASEGTRCRVELPADWLSSDAETLQRWRANRHPV